VERQHDPAAARASEELVEPRPPLDIDVLGSERERVVQYPAPLLLRAGELPAFPFRAAGHNHRAAAVGNGAGDVRIAHRVEAELDEVGLGDGVAPPAQFSRRGGGHGDAEKRSGAHGPQGSKKKPLQPFG
jgi:hypothetical protein